MPNKKIVGEMLCTACMSDYRLTSDAYSTANKHTKPMGRVNPTIDM